jgi:hypothetical protein
MGTLVIICSTLVKASGVDVESFQENRGRIIGGRPDPASTLT